MCVYVIDTYNVDGNQYTKSSQEDVQRVSYRIALG